MAGHINWSAVLSTLLLIVVLAVGPGVTDPANAAEAPSEAESTAPAATEGSTDAPEESPAPSPSEAEATEAPTETEASPSDAPESAAPLESEEPAPEIPEDDDAEAQVEDDTTEEEPAPQQRMQRDWGGSNTATVEVKVGGTRGGAGVNLLKGARLGIFRSLSADSPITTCTSTAAGICSLEIPIDGWVGSTTRTPYFLKAVSAPAGYSMVSELGVTNNYGQISRSNYGFQVGNRVCSWSDFCTWELRSGETYRSFSAGRQTADFMSADDASSGIFPFVRDNPSLPSQCGIDVAVILDFSESMRGSEARLSETVTTLVDTLQGTPSNVSLFNFGSDSHAASVHLQNHPEKQSVATDAGAETVRNWYSSKRQGSDTRSPSFRIPFNTEGTNWDRGLYAPADAAPNYDVAVVITDGNPTYHGEPTYYGPPQGNGAHTRFAEVEHAIFSANLLKAKGTHVIAVGAGNREIASPVSRSNLLAISGSGAMIQQSDFDDAADELATMMEQNCASSVAVDKTWVINGTEYTQGEQPEGIEAELLLSAPGGSTGETRQTAWAEQHDGYSAGDQVRLEENPSISMRRPGCTFDRSEVTAINGDALATPAPLGKDGFRSEALAAGLNRFSVTTTVDCEQSLTLTMEAKDKRAEASRWKLSAYSTPEDPAKGKPVFSGSQGVKSGSVAAGQTLQLAAEQGPEVFIQDDKRSNPSRAPLATGSWTCVQADGRGSGSGIPAGGEDGTVQVPLGADLSCTATSRTAEATLLKHVVNGHGGTIAPEDFQLEAAPTSDGAALASTTVSGSSAPSENTAVLLRPEQSYTVSEESLVENLAFRTGDLQRYTGTSAETVDHQDAQLWETVPDGEITVEADGAEIYRLVSYDVAPSVLPQTGGLGSSPYLIGGGALVIFAALAALKLRHPARPSWRRTV